MSKKLLFGQEGRHSVFKGVEKLALSVKATLGPKGRNVIIAKQYGNPTVTKDGVTVAKEIDLEDPFENMGAQLVKEAATKTNDAAGDGTTTATVLAHAMMEEGMKHLGSGANPILIKAGMEAAVTEAVKHLDKIKKNVTSRAEFESIATISAQDKVIGSAIADVIEQVGKDGIVTIDQGQTFGIEKEMVEGMQLDQGYISPYFITDSARMEAVLEDAYILITDQKISILTPLIGLLDECVRGRKSLVIIADSVEGDALPALVMNKVQGIIDVVAIKAPSFGDRRKEILKDIAALTGGAFISEEVGMKLETTTLKNLGRCGRIVVGKDKALIVGGKGGKKAVQDRIDEIKLQITYSKSQFDTEKLQERLGKLSGGVAVMKVGAATDVEQKERQHRVEDALAATRAAAEEGIVPGGGTALIRTLPALQKLLSSTDDKDMKIGIQIVMKAITSPAFSIAENAGVSGSVVIEKVAAMKGNDGYNALTGEYGDLLKMSVIDPKKVTRLALENACSVASMFITLEVAVVENPEPKPTQDNSNQ